MSSARFGKLYIVATPIGNLADITLRALEVLKDVDLIISEDTRETSKLLNHYNISKSQISYRDQNHSKVYSKILEILNKGDNIALLSDSGTPLISDPGFKLVNELTKNNIEIISIPGPSAFLSALVSSGLPTDKIAFVGFLSKSSNQRRNTLKKYGELDSTLIIYESPFRIHKLLSEIVETLGNREICLCSELTKKFEQSLRGKARDIKDDIESKKLKGEYVVLVAKEGF